ncbi:hypothetical protein GCM10017714_01980 [Curtobacterium pusillum]|uniref:Uncharacterized protein n=1 Tax=Curtobacterium pusillum TaxID=69373 RepID=A0AAW3TBC6_9MICO|nr:hypothetical protein [Curtobacterium pusillum]MBA8991868.1 hypothetical protein [Curtobacterium pusillum]NUU15358.1 hypothetical protein [Curtobacterium pusillum]GLK31309.1 hypothetical protein GCM10017610_15940 [Curtobacterium pusillum]
MAKDPVEELLERRDEEWRARIRHKYRFRPWRARRVIWEYDEILRRLEEWRAARRERARLIARGELSGERGAE